MVRTSLSHLPSHFLSTTSKPPPKTPKQKQKPDSQKIGQAILTHAFPTWSTPTFDETYFLSTLLHDIGTTPKNITSTLLSFEFSGALTSLNLLSSLSCPLPQAENVAETIIRHQDLGTTGTLTRVGALIHLSTLFDNAGGNKELVNVKTIEEVVALYPRKGWTGCFAGTIRREMELKPWAHTSHIEGFAEIVEANELMAPYDLLQ